MRKISGKIIDSFYPNTKIYFEIPDNLFTEKLIIYVQNFDSTSNSLKRYFTTLGEASCC